MTGAASAARQLCTTVCIVLLLVLLLHTNGLVCSVMNVGGLHHTLSVL